MTNMNHELELQLQAYADGELSDVDSRHVEGLLARDLSAKALVGELTFTKQALRGNELEAKLPEGHDFYWSKIAREIANQDRAAAPASAVAGWRWSFKFLAPMAGLAAVCLLAVISGSGPKDSAGETSSAVIIESLSPDMVTSTFRSQSDGLKVIWLSEKTDDHVTGEEVPLNNENK